ncbi:MAG: aminotransferase class IV [Opitutaceae bacterium]
MGALPYIQANTNGRLHDASEPAFSPLNRGFLYGDAIYEVWRTYGNVLFAVEEHWTRLKNSAAALHIRLPFSRDEWFEQARRAAIAFRDHAQYEGDLYLRLQVTRGAGAIGLDVALAGESEWVILVQALHAPALPAGRTGLHLAICRELRRNPPRALNPAWKTGNYLNNLLCLREARSRGADEVIILNEAGAVTEAAVCNIWFADGEQIVTPPLESGILGGITRSIILDGVGARAGLEPKEAIIRPEQFSEFSECFLTASTRDIIPVERVEAHTFQTGPETKTARVKVGFLEYATEYTAAHPDWRL